MSNRIPEDDIRRAAGHRGRYRLYLPVGANRFASLWKAEDTATDEAVLVEVIRATPPKDPDDAKLLRDRMAASQDLPTHPSVLAVRSMHAPEPPPRMAVATRAAARARARRGIEEQQWLLVLDPFYGSTLDHRAVFGALSPASVCAIAATVGEALQALHAVGIAHGSVSPASVLVSNAGDVRLIDALVGSWWSGRGVALGAAQTDRRGEDVTALARLVTNLLSPVAVPLPVRRLLERGQRYSLDELVTALHAAVSGGVLLDGTPREVAAGRPAMDGRSAVEPQTQPTIPDDPAGDRATSIRAGEDRRRRERERVEAARRRAEERTRAQERKRTELQRQRTEQAAARRLEQMRRKAREAEELRVQLETREARERRRPEDPDAKQEREVVFVPDADEHGPGSGALADPITIDEREPRATEARAVAPSTDRHAASATTTTESERVVHLPEPPPVTPTGYLDWASPAPTVTPSLPSGEAKDWSALPETEPTRWMKVAAVLASALMFGAIGAAVYYVLQSGS